MDGLDAIRQIVQPWYTAHPRFVVIGYALLAVLASHGIFQRIFEIPPKGGAPPTQTISNAGSKTQQNVVYNGVAIQQLTINVPVTRAEVSVARVTADIVDNWSFEHSSSSGGCLLDSTG